MKYILTSIEFIKTNPALLLLFIFIELVMLPFQMLRYFEELNILTAVIGLFLGAFSLYLMAGLYSCIWKAFSEQASDLKNIIKNSNHYFSTYLSVSIITGLVAGICMLSVIYIHKTAFYNSVDWVAYRKQIDANLARSIPVYVMNIIFAFILPAIYVGKNGRGSKIIRTALKFIIEHFSAATPVISLIMLRFFHKCHIYTACYYL